MTAARLLAGNVSRRARAAVPAVCPAGRRTDGDLSRRPARVYLALVLASRSAGDSWGMTALFTAGVRRLDHHLNFLYLLMQIVIAAEDCSVAAACASRCAVPRAGRAVRLPPCSSWCWGSWCSRPARR